MKITEEIIIDTDIGEIELELDDEIDVLDTLDLEQEIWDWFKLNPYPNDKEVHKLALQLGIEHEELETKIYSLVSCFINGGYSVDKNLIALEVPDEILDKGIEVEYEHVDFNCDWAKLISEKIALDHIAESFLYYDELEKMERKLEEY